MLRNRIQVAVGNAQPLPPPRMGGPTLPDAMQGLPRVVQYISPVSNAAPRTSNSAPGLSTSSLPISLIAMIVSYLDDIGDLARITRTSRLLYYVALPCLYENMSLHSYSDIRYVDGLPEGFGSGSPFVMALDGLVTKQHATLVRDFRIWGEWKEVGVEEFSKGRVPENSMMLSILLRAATDKMDKLRSFSWELNCKPFKTLYQGLEAHNTLTSLTLRFPSTRVPRPSVLVPPMSNLRAFKALDIDPLCCPDDISMLLLESKRLEDVRLHFSPRMRQEGEATMSMAQFFGRCHKANYRLKAKHFAIQNFFGQNVLGFEDIFDDEVAQSVTFLDTFGKRDPRTVFIDSTWAHVPASLYPNFVRIRANEVSRNSLEVLRRTRSKMKSFIMVNEIRKTPTTTPASVESNSATVESPRHDHQTIALWPDLLHILTRLHGDSLLHILLFDCWAVSSNDIAEIVRFCPNLEQLALAIDSSDHDIVHLLMPLFANLQVVRVLNSEHLETQLRSMTEEQRILTIGSELAAHSCSRLKLISFGDLHYKVGEIVEYVNEEGMAELRRDVRCVGRDEAMQYDIWRLDTLDISVDPVAPFTP